MSQLGNRVGIPAALAFASVITAVLSGAVLLVAHKGFGGYAEAARQPVWLSSGAVVGVLIIGSVTFAGSRIGTAAAIGILIA